MRSFMSPGKRIRSFRLKRGMTQRALGMAVGFPAQERPSMACSVHYPKYWRFRFLHWKSHISKAVTSWSSCCKRWRTNTD